MPSPASFIGCPDITDSCSLGGIRRAFPTPSSASSFATFYYSTTKRAEDPLASLGGIITAINDNSHFCKERRRSKELLGGSSTAVRRMANSEELAQINVSEEEKDKLVAEVIRYVLFKTHQSNGCPIKREELTQLITKSYHQRSLPALIINEAREKLLRTFGYEMKELQRSRPSNNRQSRASQQGAAETRSYILVSQLPSDIYSKYVEDKGTAHMSGFTFVVISIIHLAGGKISEENLWHHLRRMGLNDGDENHPVFGNNKQTLDLLVQQRFVQKEKTNGPEGNVIIYELAERALEGSVNEKLKDYITQIVNKDAAVEAN